jgi:hypothetical protein
MCSFPIIASASTPTYLVKRPCVRKAAVPNLEDSLLGHLVALARRVALDAQDRAALDARLVLLAEAVDAALALARPVAVSREVCCADLRCERAFLATTA